MGTLKQRTKDELDHLVEELTRMRDELRLKLHLAGMDVKKGYEKIEPEIFSAEQKVKRATEETAHEVKAKLHELRTKLEGLRDRASTM